MPRSLSSHAATPGSAPALRRARRALLLLALPAALAACDAAVGPLFAPDKTALRSEGAGPDGDPTSAQKSVEIQPSAVTLNALGRTQQLSVTVRNGAGQIVPNPNVTWRSLDPEVATVQGSGLVRSISVGTALITATSMGRADTATITVRQVLASVVVAPAVASVAANANFNFVATAADSNGIAIPGATFDWSSSDPLVAIVSANGVATGVAEGEATITASAIGGPPGEPIAGTAALTVLPAGSPPPGVATVTVTPPTATLAVGATQQLTAVARDADGNLLERTFTWTSATPAIATVSTGGLVTGLSAGVVGIMASTDGVGGVSIITVESGAPGPPPPAQPVCTPHASWDCVIQDQSLVGDIVVPDGQRWLIGRNVEVQGSVRTHNGTIAMRAGSSLKFVGLDLSRVVGGGMHWTPQMAWDFGIWVGMGHGATGRLDIECNAVGRDSWSRTGTGAGWRADDEYWIAPTEPGDFAPRRWYPGDPIPQAGPGLPRAEVANVTRGCTIEGPGHILIHSRAQHNVIAVRLERMGLITPTHGATTGRYALHFHHAGDIGGTRVYRVAAVNSGGRVFVPHASHNITLTDNVSVNSLATGYWWDPGAAHASTMALNFSMLVMGVNPPAWVPEPEAADAFVMEMGPFSQIIGGAAAGAKRHGFFLPNGGDDWYMDRNVSHNNGGDGIRLDDPAILQIPFTQAASYHNGGVAVLTRSRANLWEDATLVGTLVERAPPVPSGDRMPEWRRLRVTATSGPAILVTELAAAPSYLGTRQSFVDCVLTAAPGQPKVRISSSVAYHWRAQFIRCNVTPDDIEFPNPIPATLNGTSILIDNGAGEQWEIIVQNGTRTVNSF